MRDETWSAIDGFPDYAVSSHGRVKNLKFDRFLTPRAGSYGHHRVVLYREGERHDVYIHHLVAAAFVTGYSPGLRVYHNDRDRSNDDLYNLRFRERGLGQLVRNPPQPIARRVRIVETGEVFRNVETLAAHLGGDTSSIYRVLRGDRLSHKGYSFEYIEEIHD